MIPNVVGLSLREAASKLEAAGAPAPEIIEAAVPSDFRSRRPEADRRSMEFVATQWDLPGGGIRLRVVSVPTEPPAKLPAEPPANTQVVQ